MKKAFTLLVTFTGVLLSAVTIYPYSTNSPGLTLAETIEYADLPPLSEMMETEKQLFHYQKQIEKKADNWMQFQAEAESNEVLSFVEDEGFGEDSFAILGLGDSLTAGAGSEHSSGYLGMIKKFYEEKSTEKVELVNHARIGLQTPHLLRDLEKAYVINDIKKADVIFLTVGGNNIVSVINKTFTELNMRDFNDGEEEYSADMEKILSTIARVNGKADVFVIGIFNPLAENFAEVKEFNHIIQSWNNTAERTVSAHPNMTFIPIQRLFEEGTNELLSVDYFHPNEQGYEKIGELVIQRIEDPLVVQR